MLLRLNYNSMITVCSTKINTLTQENYINFINSIIFDTIPCSCGHSGCLKKHGYYDRFVKDKDISKIKLAILRVKCNVCNKTHAVIPSNIIPYSSITASDTLDIINAYENNTSFEPIMSDNFTIDESNISYVISNYIKYWKERLISESISLSEPLVNIISKCFNYFARTFMQNKCVTNILVS